MNMLTKYDAELLIGQISYKQKADIYNYSNRYEVSPKKLPNNSKPPGTAKPKRYVALNISIIIIAT